MNAYHDVRLPFDSRRAVLWKALWRHHFSALVAPSAGVLDLGCGYGEFINNVVARRPIALDRWDGFQQFLAPGVEAIVASVTDLDRLQDGAIDFAFASNLFEHLSGKQATGWPDGCRFMPQGARSEGELTQAEFSAALAALRRKLSPAGTLNILQPNYR